MGTIPLKIDHMVSIHAKYDLPVVGGNLNEYVMHLTKLPRFVTFKFPKKKFMSDEKRYLGVNLIHGLLWNSFTYSSFSFTIKYSNQ
jgi:hypothetical protein